MKNKPLTVEIKNEELRISIGMDVLAYSCLYSLDVKYGDGNVVITDNAAFLQDILDALLDEQEDGTTPVHRMLDSAAEHAVEYGGSGVS